MSTDRTVRRMSSDRVGMKRIVDRMTGSGMGGPSSVLEWILPPSMAVVGPKYTVAQYISCKVILKNDLRHLLWFKICNFRLTYFDTFRTRAKLMHTIMQTHAKVPRYFTTLDLKRRSKYWNGSRLKYISLELTWGRMWQGPLNRPCLLLQVRTLRARNCSFLSLKTHYLTFSHSVEYHKLSLTRT